MEKDFPREPLKPRLLRASFWSFALRALQSTSLVLRTVLLAMLLHPEDFGLFGIALLTLIFLDTFSKPGFYEALVQRENGMSSHLDVAWTVLAARGILLALFASIVSPAVASFFGASEAGKLIRVLSLFFAFQGLNNIGVVAFHRELDFRREFVFRSVVTLTDLTVSLAAAVALRSAWALVAGFLSGQFVQLVLSYVIHPYRPSFRFSAGKARDLFRFGFWILSMGAVRFAGMHGSALVVGRLLNTGALGLYQVAGRIPEMTVSRITMTVGEVAFPVYARMQGRADHLRQAYERIAGVSALLVVPAAAGIAVAGGVFIDTFLGKEWAPMEPVLVILSCSALFGAVALTARPLFLGDGQPQLLFRMQAARAMILVLTVYPLTKIWGTAGAASAALLGNLGMAALWHSMIRRRLGLTGRDLAGVFGFPFGASIIMAVLLFFARSSFESRGATAQIWAFPVLVFGGAAVYGACLLIFSGLCPGYRPLRGFIEAFKG